MLKVDIVLINFNSQMFLNECFESICQQSYKNIHIYVIDNGSTDRSLEIVNSWMKKDSRIELIINKSNLGAIGSIIKGFKLGQSDYIMFLPADDRIESDFIKLTVDALERNSNAAFAYTGSKMVFLDDEFNFVSEKIRFVPHYSSGVYSETSSLMLNYYTGIPLIRKKIYNESNGFDTDLLQSSDYDFYIRTSALHATVYIDSIQQKSLKHKAQLSKIYQRNGQAFWDSNKIYSRFFEDKSMPIPLRLLAKTIEYCKLTGKPIVEMAKYFINSPEPTYRNIVQENQDEYLFLCVEATLSQYRIRGISANFSDGIYGSVRDAADMANYLVSRKYNKIFELLEYHKLSITT